VDVAEKAASTTGMLDRVDRLLHIGPPPVRTMELICLSLVDRNLLFDTEASFGALSWDPNDWVPLELQYRLTDVDRLNSAGKPQVGHRSSTLADGFRLPGETLKPHPDPRNPLAMT